MEIALKILCRIAMLLFLFGTAALVAHGLRKIIPEGRFKRLLFKRIT